MQKRRQVSRFNAAHTQEISGKMNPAELMELEPSSKHVSKIDPVRMLKIEARSKEIEAQEACPLPQGAIWADVLLNGLPAFQMAVWKTGVDPVSGSVLAFGYWEVSNASEFGKPGQALDIGGQIGFYTFLLAYGGWNVTTFEPMDRNLAFIRATLCQNPILASRIKLLPIGLGSQNQVCGMASARNNAGNGIVQCKGDGELFEGSGVEFLPVGSFQIRRLDEVVREQGISRIDFMKLDIEGYQCEVFKGAGDPVKFLTAYKPRLIRSEVWANMQRCHSDEYFSWFKAAGYHNTSNPSDPECKEALPGQEAVPNVATDYYMCIDGR